MTLTDLAQAIGYTSHTYMSELEKGRKVPTTTLVVKVAKFFGVSIDYLLDNTPPALDDS